MDLQDKNSGCFPSQNILLSTKATQATVLLEPPSCSLAFAAALFYGASESLNDRYSQSSTSLQHHKTNTQQNHSYRPSRIYLTWTIFTLISALLTLAALIYTFVVTHQTNNQSINLATAAANNDLPYPLDSWTPENWYKAVLKLSFVDPSEKNSIRTNVHLMEGWRWNLIPLFLLGVAVCALAFLNLIKERSGSRRQNRESTAWLRGKGQA